MSNILHSFRSGMSATSDLRACITARVPVGVVAGELSLGKIGSTLPQYLATGGSVFIDSGAFAEVRSGTVPDFSAVLAVYWQVADTTRLLGVAPCQLFVVAPDKVGDQEGSLDRLRQYRAQVRNLIDLGCKMIVPIQRGSAGPNDMIAAVATILGTRDFIAGIPSNEAAMSIGECATILHHSFHILGRVKKNDRQIARIAALRLNQPGADITADANWLRSRIGFISAAVHAIQAMESGHRPLWVDSVRTDVLTKAILADQSWASCPLPM